MMTQTRFLAYWRAAIAILHARRWPPLPIGKAQTYWLSGFSPELAAEAEMLGAILRPARTLH